MEGLNPDHPAPVACDLIECGVRGRPYPGQAVSGDAHLIVAFPGGVLVAVIDGLGHGPEAANAAQIATASLGENPHWPIGDLVARCHEALRKSRGVVLSLASIDDVNGRLSWAGIGNVEGTLHRAHGEVPQARESLLLRGGVVGHHMPSPRVAMLPIHHGDTLVLTTDGIDGASRNIHANGWSPQRLADRLIDHHGKSTDDALAVVVRYRGRLSS